MKEIIIFLGGVVVGAAGAVFWLRKEFEGKLEEAEMRLDAVEKQVDENTKTVEKNAEKVTKNAAKLNKKVREYNKMCEKHGYSAQNTSESGVEALVREERVKNVSDDDADDVPFTGPSEGPSDEPYAISDTEFIHDEKENYTKVTLFYYRGDDILSEEDGAVVEDWKYNVGEDWKEYIGKFVEDEAFIRNDRISTDYNIVCEDMSYSDEFGDDE